MLALPLGLLLLTSAPNSAPVDPQPSPETPDRRGRILRLTVTGAPPGFDGLLIDALKPHDVGISAVERDGTLAVSVKPWSSDGIDGFAYTLDLSQAGERVGDLFPEVCMGCGAEALAQEIAGHVGDMAATLPPPQEPKAPPKAAQAPAPVIPPPTKPLMRRRPSLPFLASGIPILAAGSAIFGAGIGLVARGEVVSDSPAGDAYITVTNYRPPGVALLISGGVALAAGAVLTGIGIHRHGREQERKALRVAWRLPRFVLLRPLARN